MAKPTRPLMPAPLAVGLARSNKQGFADYLRENQTPSERMMARVLYHLGIDAEPQVVLSGWIVDFYDESTRTIIEVDGGVHLSPSQRARDQHRDDVMRGKGYRVLRFANHEVRHFMESVALNGWSVR